jgi:hypothetical protein
MKKHLIFLLLAAMAVACGKEDPKNATPPEGAVNLGLSVFWATCNIGANDPGEYGDFFAWGELEPKAEYTWENYKFRKEGNTDQTLVVTKYNSIESHGAIDSKTSLEPEDDVAHVRLGDKWRIPTAAEFKELIDSCDWTWTNRKGVMGYKVKSRVNGKSIFLPSTGYYYQEGLHGEEYGGYYWMSTTHGSTSSKAQRLFFTPKVQNVGLYYRCLGQPIRPVSD